MRSIPEASGTSIDRRDLIRKGFAGIGSAMLVGGLLSEQTAHAQTTDNSFPLNYTNVKAYGAIGDGNADDTASVAAANTAAQTAGQPLYFPAGTYRVTSLPSFNYTTVFGSGADLVTILYEGNGTLLSLSSKQKVTFKDIGFWLTGTSGTLINLSNCFGCVLNSVVLRGQHTSSTGSTYYNQTGILLNNNTGGTSFVNCQVANLGRGLATSCIQNYVSNCRFLYNHISVLGTGNNFNAGLSIANSEFVSDSAATTKNHIYIDGQANDWWLSGVWFEGCATAVLVGVAGVGGPSQFGMVNCKVAALNVDIDLQYCRQPYLANIILDADSNTPPIPLRINATNVAQGVSINLINGVSFVDFPLSTFPSGWTVIGAGKEVAAGGPIVKSSDGHAWQIQVNTSGVLSTTDLGII